LQPTLLLGDIREHSRKAEASTLNRMPEPTPIEVHCAIGEEPLSGAWVTLTLPMRSKNPYRLLFGPADAGGVIRISSDELRAKARAAIDFFPIDYSNFPEAWTGA